MVILVLVSCDKVDADEEL